MAGLRSPLQVDAVAAQVVPDTDASRTVVAYDSVGRVASVSLAEPTPGAPRPAHSYEYPAPTEAKVHVAGLAEPEGFARALSWGAEMVPLVSSADRTRFEPAPGAPNFRSTDATDATGEEASAVHDWGDRGVSATDSASRRSAGNYDANPASHLSGLSPRYSLQAMDSTPDTTAGVSMRKTERDFDTANPAPGLPKAVIADPGGLNLRTKMTYDTQGRLLSKALPADAAAVTEYAYYGGRRRAGNERLRGLGLPGRPAEVALRPRPRRRRFPAETGDPFRVRRRRAHAGLPGGGGRWLVLHHLRRPGTGDVTDLPRLGRSAHHPHRDLRPRRRR